MPLSSSPSLGIITCVRVKDLPEALALGRSAAIHSAAIPRALLIEGTIPQNLQKPLESVFQYIIPMKPEHFKLGWQAKNVVHYYSPFERTLFVDADCLVLKDLTPFFNIMQGKEVGFVVKSIPTQETGAALYAGISLQGLLKHFKVDWWPQILGGGHYYFERGKKSQALFERAFHHWGVIENVKPFGWTKGTVPDELSLQLALVEAGLGRSHTICDYPFMAWSCATTDDVDSLTGEMQTSHLGVSKSIPHDHLAVHYGGDHYNILYRRERYRLAMQYAGWEIWAKFKFPAYIAAYTYTKGTRVLGRLRKISGG